MARRKRTPEEIEADKLRKDAAAAKKSLSAAPVAKVPATDGRIEHRGKRYRFVVPGFILPGLGKFTAREASTDSELIEKILSLPGQKILRELVKP